MSQRLTAAFAVLAVLGVTACIPATPPGYALAPTPAPGPQLRAASVPQQPAPAPAPARPTPGRADFSYNGALEQGGWIRGQVPGDAVSASLGGETVDFDSEGRFFAGFDRDAPARLQLTATLADGRTVSDTLTIAPRDWQIEHVDVPLRQQGPSEAFMKIRRPELAAIDAARAQRNQTDGWRQKFIWPVTGRISGRFGSQRIYRGVPGSYHSGVDIATGESGTPYVAPADGVVVLAADHPFSLEGNLLMIDHGMGLNSAFLHSSRIVVHVGQHVKRGQLLGYIGATGRATGPHLHWSLKWEDWRLDPQLLAGPMP